MNLGDLLQMAIGGGEEQDPSQAGLPPMTMGQYVNQVPTPVQDAAAQQGIYPKQGMEAIPFGPGGWRGGWRTNLPGAPVGGAPAPGAGGGAPSTIPGQRGPMSGDLMGGPLVPRGNPVGASGPRGATYDGTVNPPQGTAVVPRGGPGPGGAGPGVGGPGGPGGGVPGGGGANV